MTEVIIFTGTAIVLYVVCDALVRRILAAKPEWAPYRSLFFFFIFLCFTLISFELIKRTTAPPNDPVDDITQPPAAPDPLSPDPSLTAPATQR